MQIRYKATGELSHVENAFGRALIAEGRAEEVNPGEFVTAPKISGSETYRLPKPGDAKPPQPHWDVVTVGESVKRLAIKLNCGDLTLYYTGTPERANARREWQGGGRWLNGFGREVPKEIQKQYADLRKRHKELRGGVYADEPVDNEANRRMAEEGKIAARLANEREAAIQEALRQPGGPVY